MSSLRWLGLALIVASMAIVIALATLNDPPPRATPRDELSARVSALEGQLAAAQRDLGDARLELLDARTRLLASERQIVNFQIFVSRFEGASVDSSGLPATSPSRDPSSPKVDAHAPQAVYPRKALPLLRAGEPVSSVLAVLGPPEKEATLGKSGKRLSYFQQGVSVELDEQGLVKFVELHGAPESDGADANGTRPAFDSKGEWYRPSTWQGPGGVETGMLGAEVVARLGAPGGVTLGLSEWALHYPKLDLVVFLDGTPHHAVVSFRIGQRAVQHDVNGNIR